jgi:hypothetical protein
MKLLFINIIKNCTGNEEVHPKTLLQYSEPSSHCSSVVNLIHPIFSFCDPEPVVFALKFTPLRFSLVCREDCMLPKVGDCTIVAHCFNNFSQGTDW